MNMVLMKDYGETEIGLIDETFARRIFDESKAPQELKTPAASILVFVLKWGHEHVLGLTIQNFLFHNSCIFIG